MWKLIGLQRRLDLLWDNYISHRCSLFPNLAYRLKQTKHTHTQFIKDYMNASVTQDQHQCWHSETHIVKYISCLVSLTSSQPSGQHFYTPTAYIFETKGDHIHCFGVWGAFEWQRCLGKRTGKLIKLSNPCSQRTWDSCISKYLFPAVPSIPGLASLSATIRQSRSTCWLGHYYQQQHVAPREHSATWNNPNALNCVHI